MNNKNLKIMDIEKEFGIIYQKVETFGLTLWYDKVRKKRINELSNGDIARLIRQNLYLSYIVPEAIKRLYIEPTIGEQYSGEVLESFTKINVEFWHINTDLFKELCLLINKITRKELKLNCDWLYPEEESEFLGRIEHLKMMELTNY